MLPTGSPFQGCLSSAIPAEADANQLKAQPRFLSSLRQL